MHKISEQERGLKYPYHTTEKCRYMVQKCWYAVEINAFEIVTKGHPFAPISTYTYDILLFASVFPLTIS